MILRNIPKTNQWDCYFFSHHLRKFSIYCMINLLVKRTAMKTEEDSAASVWISVLCLHFRIKHIFLSLIQIHTHTHTQRGKKKVAVILIKSAKYWEATADLVCKSVHSIRRRLPRRKKYAKNECQKRSYFMERIFHTGNLEIEKDYLY